MAKLVAITTAAGRVLKAVDEELVKFDGEGDPPAECCCTVGICCCANEIQRTLKVVFGNDGTGIFADLGGTEMLLTYREDLSLTCEETGNADGQYVFRNTTNPVFNGGTCTITTFDLICTCEFCALGPGLSTWSINVTGDCWNELAAPSTVQCDPFELTGTAFEATTGDTISYVITEAAA